VFVPRGSALSLLRLRDGRCACTLDGHAGGRVTAAAVDVCGARAWTAGADGMLLAWVPGSASAPLPAPAPGADAGSDGEWGSDWGDD
jgi:hypothetical protein